MSPGQQKIAVIGGGFAGVVAARDLAAAGFEVDLHEARERIGGRTWTAWDPDFERNLEIGGTHVHWSQPHLWAEISRYQAEIVRIRPPAHASWLVGEHLHEGTVEEVSGLLDGLVGESLSGAREAFPLPYAPLHCADKVNALDGVSVAALIDGLNLSEEKRLLLEAMWSLNFCGPAEDGSAAKALHLGALVNADPQYLMAALDDYKLKQGTGELLSRIATDHPFTTHFGSEVDSVEHLERGVRIGIKGGPSRVYDAVVVAVPASVLPRLRFVPELPHFLATLGTEGQISAGFKVWARARVADARGWFGAAARPQRITFARIEDEYPDGTVLLRGFGVEAEGFDMEDRDQVQEAFRPLLPDVEIVACRGHDWITDPYARETWPFPAVGTMTRGLSYLPDDASRLVFAGTSLAHGWGGYIDGAIETGTRAAEHLKRLFAARHHEAN